MFSNLISRMSRPILTSFMYEEPDDKAPSSDKDVFGATLPARTTSSIVIFVAWTILTCAIG